MKKLFSVLTTATLLFSACSGEKTTTKEKESETIKIGSMAPLTGPVAIYGISSTNGMKLAVEEINKNGGVLGKQIEFNLLDEKGDTTEAVNTYNKLVDWGMDIVVGGITSKCALAVAEVAKNDGMPMITPTGTQLNITEGKENVFRVAFTDPFQGKLLAKLAKEKYNSQAVAVLVNNSSDYSDGVAKEFVKTAKDLGLNVVAVEGYADGDKDFRSQLTKISSKNPDFIFVPDYYEQDGLIAMQTRELGINAQILGSDGWDGVLKVVDNSSYNTIEGVRFSSHYAMDDPDEKVQNFVKKYREKFNEDPSAFSALSYDAVYMAKQAIETSKSTNKEDVVKAIKNINFDGVTGQLTFDENNNPVKQVTLLKIEDGTYKFDSLVD